MRRHGFPFAEEMLYQLLLDRSADLNRLILLYDTPGQRKSMRKAAARFAIRELGECDAIEQIASLERRVVWSVEDLAALGQDIAAIVAELFSVGRDVDAALKSDNLVMRVRGLERASERLTGIQDRAAAHGFSASRQWGEVVNRWRSLINDALNEYPEVDGIPNPYNAGSPVTLRRAALFRGRGDLAEAVARSLSGQARSTIVLYGPRRMGKTSFLLQLPRLLPVHVVPIFVDLQSAGATDSTYRFLYTLARAIVRDARNHSHLTLPAPEKEAFEHRPFEAFADWLDEIALPRLEKRNLRLLLSLDEFEKLGQAIKTGRVSERVLDELRHTIQHREVVSLLFAGVQTLSEMGPRWSSYFISVRPLRITYLRPKEAADLVRNPDPESGFNLEYTDEALESILTATRCHPYLVQLVCEAVVQLANERRTPLATLDLVREAQTMALQMGEPYFCNLWDEFTGTDVNMIAAGQTILRQVATATGPVVIAADTPVKACALERLLRQDVLEYMGDGVQFQVPLVRRWVQERQVTAT